MVTEYAVLIGVGEEAWEPVGIVEAHSADAAIRQGSEGKPGTYVAVPTRSWKPMTVRTETHTKVVVS